MKIYHVKTQEDYDALMRELESKGVRWNNGTMPTEGNCWRIREENTAIYLHNDEIITHGSLIATKRGHHDTPIQKYKASKTRVERNSVKDLVKEVSENNEELFHKIIQELEQTYLAKNQDYGNSFEQSLDEFGEVAGVVRIGDKFNRAKSLMDNQPNVKGESKIDTWLDMTNYCIMQTMWLMKQE